MSKLNANGATKSVSVSNTGLKIALHGDFGGGTVGVQQKINDEWHPVMSEGTAVELTQSGDEALRLGRGDEVRLSLAGATSPDIDYRITHLIG